MKHVMFGAKSMFIGDEAATVLIDYAAHVAQARTGDRVDLRGYSSDGNEIITTFLLNSGSPLVAETTSLPLEEFDNRAAIDYMRGRIQAFAISPEFVDGYRAAFEEDAA